MLFKIRATTPATDPTLPLAWPAVTSSTSAYQRLDYRLVARLLPSRHTSADTISTLPNLCSGISIAESWLVPWLTNQWR